MVSLLIYLRTSSLTSLMKMKLKVTQSCPTLCNPMDYTVHGILQARILERVAFPFSGDLPNPGVKPMSPTLQADSLPAEPQEEPRNTGVGDLSLLHQIFLTQELNQSLLKCRQILYQLSYQGNPSLVCRDPKQKKQQIVEYLSQWLQDWSDTRNGEEKLKPRDILNN